VSGLEAPLGPAAKLWLATEVLATYVDVRLRLRRRGLRPTLDAIRGGRHGRADADAGARAARAVTAVLRLLPADSRCLVTSLVLIAILERRGAAAALVIGAVPKPTFAAHAWVELGGVPLLRPGVAGDGRLVELP
jgi:Transglutaminase-like superfamily